ncbi:hypothetical protein [Amycolatopsis sp. Hca4]|uniref:hypothetical protein n=1 Tax=Amycolatopsis sp. Hca4 TaxID=2742131 RepID=UPI0015915D12|nr:hypothetical protein [Amycolatopsis sp. Hca4]QKV78654.1 hypothetical protein HUT10_36410 [Amycolatopsis sp. Hca4]
MGELEAEETTTRAGRGLAIASLAIGAAGFTLAVATWAAWLIVRPGIVSAWLLSWVTQAFVLVLGALWFALLPISVLALVFGICAGSRTRPGSARIGATLAVITALLALSGAAVFATTSWHRIGPPIAYFDPGTPGPR